MIDIRYSFGSVIVILLIAIMLSDHPKIVIVSNGSINMRTEVLKLVAEFRDNILEDVSADGKLLLLYQTSSPLRIYSVNSGGISRNHDQSEASNDILRIVDRESRRELTRIRVEFFPESVQFIPGTQEIFFDEPVGDDKAGRRFRIWNFSTGEVRNCTGEDASHLRHTTVINAKYAISATLQERGGEVLGKLSLSDCFFTTAESANPSAPRSTIWGGISLSPDKRHLAYGTGEFIAIRDTDSLKLVRLIKPETGLIFGEVLLYTPDGRHLLVVASNTMFDRADTRRYLLFYETKSYEVIRKLDITHWNPTRITEGASVRSNAIGTAVAISPDGKLLAVASTKEERKRLATSEQAQVVIYNLVTGEELTRTAYPPVPQKRSNPFAAKLTRLYFTSDGKCLVASTNDTRMWEVAN